VEFYYNSFDTDRKSLNALYVSEDEPKCIAPVLTTEIAARAIHVDLRVHIRLGRNANRREARGTQRQHIPNIWPLVLTVWPVSSFPKSQAPGLDTRRTAHNGGQRNSHPGHGSFTCRQGATLWDARVEMLTKPFV
jgi:hypothetical protein